MLHIYSADLFVESIVKNNRNTCNFDPCNPWGLLHRTGRIDRFPTMAAARAEAQKIGPRVTFSRN